MRSRLQHFLSLMSVAIDICNCKTFYHCAFSSSNVKKYSKLQACGEKKQLQKKRGSNLLSEWVCAFLEHEFSVL